MTTNDRCLFNVSYIQTLGFSKKAILDVALTISFEPWKFSLFSIEIEPSKRTYAQSERATKPFLFKCRVFLELILEASL
jgi:hypothetical protein